MIFREIILESRITLQDLYQNDFPSLGNDIAQGFREHGAELKAAGYQPVTGLKQLLTAFKIYMQAEEPKTAKRPARRRVVPAQPPAENI